MKVTQIHETEVLCYPSQSYWYLLTVKDDYGVHCEEGLDMNTLVSSVCGKFMSYDFAKQHRQHITARARQFQSMAVGGPLKQWFRTGVLSMSQ